MTKGKSCGGSDINQWDDGSSANWGTVSGVTECKNECDKHAECAGFVNVYSTGKCGYWKKGPLKLKVHDFGTDRDCYMKIKATEGDEYFYLIYLVKKE